MRLVLANHWVSVLEQRAIDKLEAALKDYGKVYALGSPTTMRKK